MTQVIIKEKRIGGGFLGLLTLLFIGLKLTGQITWSWWWVLAPLWAFPALLVGLFGVGGILLALFAIASGLWTHLRSKR